MGTECQEKGRERTDALGLCQGAVAGWLINIHKPDLCQDGSGKVGVKGIPREVENGQFLEEGAN